MSNKIHDLHDYLKYANTEISEEYKRIMKRATEDPGTAGDQGEENWAKLLRNWLPSYLHIITKGRIITDNGYVSPQVDLLILHPSYPQILLDKKLYLAGGVVAAFECKTTLKAEHISKSVQTAAEIKKNIGIRQGTPYKELNSSIIYGLLAHSHSWNKKNSKPIENIEKTLQNSDKNYASSPYQQIDYITVADLGTWINTKQSYIGPFFSFYNEDFKVKYGEAGCILTTFLGFLKDTENQKDTFLPIGALLSSLFSKLAWTFNDMRELDNYFRKMNITGNGKGTVRNWPFEIYSKGVQNKILSRHLTNAEPYSEWNVHL